MSVEIEHRSVGDADSVAAVLWLNRPEVLNAIDWEMLRALDRALEDADRDDRVCTVLIGGRGRAFSAGGDLKSYLALQRDPVEFPRFLDDLHRALSRIGQMPKPVVALVNGITAAGGLELMLACDFAYAARSATLGDMHLNYGQIGGGGVLARLPRTISPARARELLLSAESLDAEDARDWGLVNRVVEDGELLERGLDFARGIATRSPAAIAQVKRVMNAGLADGTGLDATLRLEREASARYCLTLPDSHEGLRAFSEKRAPRFR